MHKDQTKPDLPTSLEVALNRLTKGLKPGISQGFVCAMTSAQCLKCKGHKGVSLESDGVYIHAKLCDCVKNCSICVGACASPKNGRFVPCSEPEPKRIVGLMNEAKIPARYLEAELGRFSNFSGTGKQVVAQIQRWIDNFTPGKSSGLLLSGSVGVGKTYILSALAKHLVLRGFSVRFTDFFQLLNELREAYSVEKGDPVLLKPLHDVDVLIIDELGKGRNTEWEISIADNLISDRYNGNKCIIASTNYSLKDSPADQAQRQLDIWNGGNASGNQMNTDAFETLVRRLGPRIFSRLKEMTVFQELTGDDFRRH